MTNTRITDPEILERRFPVLLRRFVLRDGSGGEGMHSGGNGVIRQLEFRRPLIVSILSERRSFQPYGLEGGNPGERGLNLLYFRGEDRVVNLGGKNTVQVSDGDRLTIYTPGGGGYGAPGQTRAKTSDARRQSQYLKVAGGSLHQYTLDQESA